MAAPTTRLMLTAAGFAILMDVTTTLLALQSSQFGEASPAVAHMISSHGLVYGVLVSAVLRMFAFALVALVAEVVRPAWPLWIVGFGGAAFTLWVALSNIQTMAGAA